MKWRTRRFTGVAIAAAFALSFDGAVLGASDPVDRDSAAAWHELQHRLAARLQSDADPRRQLIASLLLSAPMAHDSPAVDKAAAERMEKAQTIFARVRSGTDDPWILWVAVNGCRVGPELCDADAAIDRLLRIESDNAAVWQLALARAHRAKDRDATLAALQGMAARKRHTIYFAEAVRAWADAFGVLAQMPELDHLMARNVGVATQATSLGRSEVIDLIRMHSFNHAVAFGIPSMSALTEICRPESLLSDEWVDACRGAADVMLDGDTVAGIGVGLGVAYRMAQDDQERALLERRRAQMNWLMESFVSLELEGVDEKTGLMDPAAARELIDSWNNAISELDATRALLRARGMSLEPPPDYKRRGPSLAERESEQMQQRR